MTSADPTSPRAQVLRLLLAAPGQWRSGAEMGRLTGRSRAAVNKAMEELRKEGLVIEARAQRGYRLVSEPPLVLASRVEARLAPGGLGIPCQYFAEIDSTNLEAARQAASGAPHGACFVAEHQTAGRGRLSRGWSAPPGSALTFSLLLRVPLPLNRAFFLNNVVSLAVAMGVADLTGLVPALKWPNDIYLDGKKLVGILAEMQVRDLQVESLVVGAGVNVNQDAAWLAGLDQPAASLAAASGRTWDRVELLAAILTRADDLLARFLAGEQEALAAEYQRRCLWLGQEVMVRDGDQQLSGVAQGIGACGELLLRLADGTVRALSHGDVSHLRPVR